MLKNITLLVASAFILSSTLLAESTMKTVKQVNVTEESAVTKNVPKKEIKTSAMKCETGKCSSGDANKSKVIPKKEIAPTKSTVKQLFNVKTVVVKELSTAKEKVNYGYIVAEDSAMVDVLTWYNGFVEELYADTLYKKVKKGDALAKVYSPEVYKAKQDYLNSINYNKKTSMPEMLESAKIKLKLLGVDEKEIKCIETDKYADIYTTVYAPISGWIFEKNINQGASFTSKKRLFKIVNLEKVWMEVKLFQEELKMLPTLENFMVKPKGMEKTFKAQKSLLYPMLDTKEATATLRLVLNNDSQESLRPGMYAKVHATAKSKNRLLIPRTAAMRKNGIWYAFLATEFKGEYEPVIINVKPLDNKYFEVTKGLHAGDTLVNNALFMMDSDAQINSVY